MACPQKLDERKQRVKPDGRDARTLCLKLSRFVEGNKEELAVVRVPTEAEEQLRALTASANSWFARANSSKRTGAASW